MKRGRKPLSAKRTRLHVYVDEALYSQFQIYHFNAKTGKVKFGDFSEFVNTALAEYIGKKNESTRAGARTKASSTPSSTL